MLALLQLAYASPAAELPRVQRRQQTRRSNKLLRFLTARAIPHPTYCTQSPAHPPTHPPPYLPTHCTPPCPSPPALTRRLLLGLGQQRAQLSTPGRAATTPPIHTLHPPAPLAGFYWGVANKELSFNSQALLLRPAHPTHSHTSPRLLPPSQASTGEWAATSST